MCPIDAEVGIDWLAREPRSTKLKREQTLQTQLLAKFSVLLT